MEEVLFTYPSVLACVLSHVDTPSALSLRLLCKRADKCVRSQHTWWETRMRKRTSTGALLYAANRALSRAKGYLQLAHAGKRSVVGKQIRRNKKAERIEEHVSRLMKEDRRRADLYGYGVSTCASAIASYSERAKKARREAKSYDRDIISQAAILNAAKDEVARCKQGVLKWSSIYFLVACLSVVLLGAFHSYGCCI